MISERLSAFRDKIRAAAVKYNRNPEEIRLIAVSKTQPFEPIAEAITAGQILFGENRVQELEEKYQYFARQEVFPEWHLIGSLQTNKVKYIAPFVTLIHSLDSEKLLDEIQKQAQKINRIIDCLIQVNISEEPQKGGVEPGKVNDLLEKSGKCSFVRIKGLMGIALDTDDKSLIRNQFATLRNLKRHLAPHFPDLSELSMGMSGDYEEAIAEGATYIRVGSAIFGERTYIQK